MSITVSDCMKLTALREAKVVAGGKGLNNIVASITVLEYADVSSLVEGLFLGNELIITAFISVMDNVEAQCSVIRRLHEVGEVGLILYYVGLFLPRLDERVIETADELGFPLVLMPENCRELRYSEVICEVMEAVIKDRMQETHYVNEILERISLLQSHQRTIDSVLRMISDRTHCSLLLTDRTFTLLNSAAWPMAASVEEQELLQYFRKRPAFLIEQQSANLHIEDKTYSVNCQPVMVDNGFNMNIIVLSDNVSVTRDIASQAAEVIQLFFNIWKSDHCNSGYAALFRAIMNDQPVKMRRLAEILHVDVASIHVMWVIKLIDSIPSTRKMESTATRILIDAKTFLQKHDRIAIVDIFEDSIIALMNTPPYIEQVTPLSEAFLEELQSPGTNIMMAQCTDLQNTAEVREAYLLVEDYMEYARIIYPQKQIITMDEVRFAKKCREIIVQGEMTVNSYLLPLRPLRNDDSQQEEELLSTLCVFLLDAHANMQMTGQLLFLHKNTIKYRLNKINSRLSHHVLKMPEAFELYTAAAIERLLKESGRSFPYCPFGQ